MPEFRKSLQMKFGIFVSLLMLAMTACSDNGSSAAGDALSDWTDDGKTRYALYMAPRCEAMGENYVKVGPAGCYAEAAEALTYYHQVCSTSITSQAVDLGPLTLDELKTDLQFYNLVGDSYNQNISLNLKKCSNGTHYMTYRSTENIKWMLYIEKLYDGKGLLKRL